MAISKSASLLRPEGNDDPPGVIHDPKYLKEATYSRPEDPEERDARLEQERADADLRRWKDRVLFIVAIATALGIGVLCIWIIVDNSISADDKKLVIAFITPMFTGFIGYLTGKAAK